MTPADIFPYLVTDGYFSLPPGVPASPTPLRFPPHRPIGHGVSVLLMGHEGKLRKALHAEDLKAAGVDPDDAEQIAIRNLSRLIEDGETFKIQLFETESGFNYAGWIGNELTASCLLWTMLFQWACDALKTDRVLAIVPERRVLLVMAAGDESFRHHMRAYARHVAEGMDKQISDEVFEVTADGIVAFSDV
jgi:hypothetical protein